MEVAKIMDMYVMTILDNLFEKMDFDPVIENYSDDFINVTNIQYTDIIKYIKFITMHLGDILKPEEPVLVSGLKYYGVPSPSELLDKLDYFETELKRIVSGISDEEVDEFLKSNISETLDGVQSEIISINKYSYKTNINEVEVIPAEGSYMTSRKDGKNIEKEENSFVIKLRKMLLGFGYSSSEFQNSATFILDLLESTNLLSIMEDDDSSISYTKSKYFKMLYLNNISSQILNMNSLYNVSLKNLLQLLKDYTENKIFKEDYFLSNSEFTNVLAINSVFVEMLDLVVETFFERSTSPYNVPDLEAFLTSDNGTESLPAFLQDFITLLKKETTTDDEKSTNITKYNSVLSSLNNILLFITRAEEFDLLKTVNTASKNFSDAEYLNFLISLLSFFMSYKVTLYEESHQLDLSNPRETFIFAEDLLI
jgi:hypothetical protein